MSKSVLEISLRQAALITGIAIVLMTIAAVVATDVTIETLFAEDSPEITTQLITSSQSLYRTGIFSWIVVLVCDILAAWGLYIFLKPVNRDLSLIMAWFRLVYAAILATAVLKLTDVLLIINAADNGLVSLESAQMQVQILQSVSGFYQYWSIGLIIFGAHILLLGYMIVRSAYIPKYWGILLLIAGAGYVINNVTDIMIPGYESTKLFIQWMFLIPMLSEVGLGVWLLIKGRKVADV
jgi:hypothetical protein